MACILKIDKLLLLEHKKDAAIQRHFDQEKISDTRIAFATRGKDHL